MHYYTGMANASVGFAAAQKFNRMFMIPSMGHCSGVGSVSGTAGPAANTNTVPLPKSGQLFDALVEWVERGTAPALITLTSADDFSTRRTSLSRGTSHAP